MVDVELAYDAPHKPNHCGTCTRCLDACPTDAFAGPYQLDARRCISYWTIEHRGMLAEPDAAELDGWVFGCDVCQDVCPWNRKAPPAGDLSSTRGPNGQPRPDRLVDARPGRMEARLKGTALRVPSASGLVRNAALVLGSAACHEAAAPLAARLDDRREDAVVRASAAWALGRIGTDDAVAGPSDATMTIPIPWSGRRSRAWTANQAPPNEIARPGGQSHPSARFRIRPARSLDEAPRGR